MDAHEQLVVQFGWGLTWPPSLAYSLLNQIGRAA